MIKELLKDGHFQIRALVRLTSNYNPPTSSNIETLNVDFDDSSSLVTALQSQDAIVCCVPGSATKFVPQKLLIDAAIAAGVKLFFANEFASNILSPHYEVFPTQFVGDKVKVRKYLEERASSRDITYTALNGGPFFDLCMYLIFLLHPQFFPLPHFLSHLLILPPAPPKIIILALI